ncbi:hypothetical protein HPB51_004780 [Rhipicephalus microplus]|uniref:Ig-like domain-containing protein n=1 Tax=Rhipicephalus microplus TaxID=6941 RepID=A0A9J6E5M3_RHIMP|nr:hypothetical protein HPB51_004780 [Rhipicephalus microplus]
MASVTQWFQSREFVRTVHAPKPQTSGFQPNLALGDDAIASWHGEGLRVAWTKENEDDLSAHDRVSFHRASKNSITLGIRDVRRGDVGNYGCVVSYGESSSASVTVPLAISGEHDFFRLSVYA